MLMVTAALVLGLMIFAPADAADISDDDFKAMLDQDTKIINAAVQSVDKADPKGKKVADKNAGSGIKSSALMIAGYANARIDGKNADADGKSAAIRDTALKIYKLASAKDFKGVGEATKTFASPAAAAGAKKIDLAAAVKELGTATEQEVTQKEVMHNFLKKEQHGTNIEADIIANSKKAVAKPADINLMAQRLMIMAEYNKIVVKADNAEAKKQWAEYNDNMIKAIEALQATTKKKTSAADLAKAFTVVDGSCKACHDDFK
jgi:hypothetical protein